LRDSPSARPDALPIWPVAMQSPFALSVILERDDPRDAFVSNDYASLDELPDGAVVGTSSLRRESQIRQRYPRLKVQPLRGNLDTDRKSTRLNSSHVKI